VEECEAGFSPYDDDVYDGDENAKIYDVTQNHPRLQREHHEIAHVLENLESFYGANAWHLSHEDLYTAIENLFYQTGIARHDREDVDDCLKVVSH